MAADEPALATLLLPMGLNNTRAFKLKRFSQVELRGFTSLPMVGLKL